MRDDVARVGIDDCSKAAWPLGKATSIFETRSFGLGDGDNGCVGYYAPSLKLCATQRDRRVLGVPRQQRRWPCHWPTMLSPLARQKSLALR